MTQFILLGRSDRYKSEISKIEDDGGRRFDLLGVYDL